MSTTEDAGSETPNQRAARLRREKRQAKLTSEDRLAKIKALNGGVAPREEVLGGPAIDTPTKAQPASVSNDPDEVDISTQSFGGPRPNEFAASTDDPMFQAMMRMQQQQARQQGPQTSGGNASQQEDPMAQMMKLMGMSGDPNDPNSVHNTEDPMQMLSALLGSAGKAGQAQGPPPSTRSAYLWRLTHAIFAFIIAGYIATTSTFDGSLFAREQSVFTQSSDGYGSRLFLIFITAELGLQSARFFLEGGQLQGAGILATISNIAPEPFAGYVRTLGRWLSILGSIVSDAMVVVFVLGVMAWWKGPSSVS